MAKEGSIAIPTGGNISKSLMNYGTGLIAGLGYRVFTNLATNFIPGGGGLIGGALAAAVTGALVPGKAGEILSVTLGFQQGQQGFNSLIGGVGLGGGGGGGGGDNIAVI